MRPEASEISRSAEAPPRRTPTRMRRSALLTRESFGLGSSVALRARPRDLRAVRACHTPRSFVSTRHAVYSLGKTLGAAAASSFVEAADEAGSRVVLSSRAGRQAVSI